MLYLKNNFSEMRFLVVKHIAIIDMEDLMVIKGQVLTFPIMQRAEHFRLQNPAHL